MGQDAYLHFVYLCEPHGMGVHEQNPCAVLFDAGNMGLQRRSATAVIKHCGSLARLPLTGPLRCGQSVRRVLLQATRAGLPDPPRRRLPPPVEHARAYARTVCSQ